MKEKKAEFTSRTFLLEDIGRKIRRILSEGGIPTVELYQFKSWMASDWFDPDDFENDIKEYAKNLRCSFKVVKEDHFEILKFLPS